MIAQISAKGETSSNQNPPGARGGFCGTKERVADEAREHKHPHLVVGGDEMCFKRLPSPFARVRFPPQEYKLST